MYADLHCDTFYKCYTEILSFSDKNLHITEQLLKAYVPGIQTFAHFIPENVIDKYTFFQEMLENSLEIIHNTDILVPFKEKADILQVERTGKILCVLSVENGDFFGDNTEENIKRANYLEQNKIRFLSLSYNNGTSLCGGAYCNYGLTKRGRQIASLLCSRGITLDVSHLSEKATDDILDTDMPAIATHSNCKSLCNHMRNLSDKNIYRLCEKQSLIGVNLYSPFLNKKGTADIVDVVSHIERILSFGGDNTVTLGADFDGCDMLPCGITGIRDIHKLYDAKYGIREKFYNNVKNYLLK